MRDRAFKALNQNAADSGEIRVKHYVADFSEAFLQSQLQEHFNIHDKEIDEKAVRHSDREVDFDLFRKNNGFGESPFQTARLAQRINMLYGDDAENQMAVRHFIDA